MLSQARYFLVQIMADSCPCGECDAPTWEQSARMLFRATGHDRWLEAVATVIDAMAEDAVGQAWDRGWMPRDVLSLMSKDTSSPTLKAARTLMRSELRRYAEAQLSDLWSAQRESLAESSAPESVKETLAGREGPAWVAAAAAFLEALYTFADLEPIPMVQPRPGGRTGSVRGGGAESAKVYEKIRALLAKAESTDSDAEAEAFTAKAQQLIARHSINEALLAEARDAALEAAAVRVYVEKPYEKQKCELLHVVADANGCRAVYSLAAGFCTVVGARANLRSVELLYNSLLVQATSAMTRAGARQDSAGRSRTRSFRQSFLASFAVRIGERLADSAEATVREVADETGTDLVPVMRLQREAVDAKTEELFPNLTFRAATRISNYEGHIAGRAAADRARLQGAEEIRTH
jgi:RNA-binding protein YhbY